MLWRQHAHIYLTHTVPQCNAVLCVNVLRCAVVYTVLIYAFAAVPAAGRCSSARWSMSASPGSISFTPNIIPCYWPLSLLSAAMLIFNEGASTSGCHFSAACRCRGDAAAKGSGAWPIIFHLNQIRQAFSARTHIQYLFWSPLHLHPAYFKCYTLREERGENRSTEKRGNCLNHKTREIGGQTVNYVRHNCAIVWYIV